jgi:isopenicillin N synthase-like dioxygenase
MLFQTVGNTHKSVTAYKNLRYMKAAVTKICDHWYVTGLLSTGPPQDQTRGALQVLNKQGLWMEANPIPGALTMNIGDMYANAKQLLALQICCNVMAP